MKQQFISVCAGIEAASVALGPHGFEAALLSEIEDFPRKLLQHHYRAEDARLTRAELGPPLWGDFTALRVRHLRRLGLSEGVDGLCGGTPCQSFSWSGKRGSLSDDRGNLTLAYVKLAHALRAAFPLRFRWALWENVPGVLSTDDNAFGCFLGALVGHDAPLPAPDGRGRWPNEGMVEGPRARLCWRVLDAQHFGLAQRRQRVFVVVSFGADGPDPAAVLFERRGVHGRPAARSGSGKRTAGAAEARSRGGGQPSEIYAPDVSPALKARDHKGPNSDGDGDGAPLIAMPCVTGDVTHALTAESFDASEDGTGRGTPIVPTHAAYALSPGAGSDGPPSAVLTDVAPALTAEGEANKNGRGLHVVAFSAKDSGHDAADDISPTLRAMSHADSHANGGGQVAVAFDTTQITHPANRSNPQPDDPCHTLNANAHVPAIATIPILEAGARTGKSTSDKSFGMGVGEDGDPMYTLQAGKQHAVAFALRGRDGGAMPEIEGDKVGALRAGGGGSSNSYVAHDEVKAFTISQQANGFAWESDVAPAIQTGHGGNQQSGIRDGSAVRRLTMTECERLQGFDDHYTLLPGRWSRKRPAEDFAETVAYLRWHGFSEEEATALANCPDGPRYKALGNSWAVSVVSWIGGRLAKQLTTGPT